MAIDLNTKWVGVGEFDAAYLVPTLPIIVKVKNFSAEQEGTLDGVIVATFTTEKTVFIEINGGTTVKVTRKK